MSLAAYPEYKDSGIPWLGMVPAHWEVKKLKHLATCNQRTLPETYPEDAILRYVEISDVTMEAGIHSDTEVSFAEAPSRARRLVADGDVIISTVRTYLKAMAVVKEPPSNLVVSTGFAVFTPTGAHSNFLGYALKYDGFIGEVIARSTGVSYPAINASEIQRIEIVVPPLAEQQAIAAWLDERTGRIDDAVTAQRTLLEQLKEKRRALIAHAVTRGLDPAALLKDSGIEWLGQVPAHWDVWKVSHIFARVGSGTTPPASEEKWYEDGIVPWVTTGELRENVIYETSTKVTQAALNEFSALKVHPVGSLVIAMYGATIGRLAILGVPAVTNQACCVMSGSLSHCTKFIYHWLHAFKGPIIEEHAVGGGQPNISLAVITKKVFRRVVGMVCMDGGVSCRLKTGVGLNRFAAVLGSVWRRVRVVYHIADSIFARKPSEFTNVFGVGLITMDL